MPSTPSRRRSPRRCSMTRRILQCTPARPSRRWHRPLASRAASMQMKRRGTPLLTSAVSLGSLESCDGLLGARRRGRAPRRRSLRSPREALRDARPSRKPAEAPPSTKRSVGRGRARRARRPRRRRRKRKSTRSVEVRVTWVYGAATCGHFALFARHPCPRRRRSCAGAEAQCQS